MTDKARFASEITEVLRDWSDNRREDSADALLKLVYAERDWTLAKAWLRREMSTNGNESD